MAIVPCSVPEGYDKDFAIVGAPYLYQDMDHLRRTTETGVFKQLFESTRKFNFQVLTVYTAGERNIYSDKPINSPDDLKGMIVRVNDSPTYLNMVKYTVSYTHLDVYKRQHLYYYENYKTPEIAKILGKGESTVRSLLSRGREKLKVILKEEYDFE